MTRRRVPLIALAAVAASFGCGEAPAPETEDWQAAFTELEEAYDATEDHAEKAALAEGFLARFPETERTGDVAGVIVYHRGRQLDDWQRAWSVLHDATEAINDPAIDFEVALELSDAARALDRTIDLAPYIAALEAERPLTFTEHDDVVEVAAAMESWTLLEEHARAALDLATVEAYRHDYPDLEISDEDVAARARRREAMARSWLGWALVQTGRVEDGFAEFETAEASATTTYLGVTDGPLDRLRGQAEVEFGDLEAGLERLARAALWADDEQAREALVAAYPRLEAAQPFEDWLWETRLRTATMLDDVTLAEPDGTTHSLADLRGEAMLLAFWFPT